MIVEKLNNNIIGNYIQISDIIKGFRVTEIYEGYTIKQAKKHYKQKHYE
tara:strand:- start:409 stop:555 length:147 start_codon:yes stop_codon:yes gene_type:complete